MIEAILHNLPEVLVLLGVTLAILETIAPGTQLIVAGAGLFFAGVVGIIFAPAAHPIVLAGLTLVFAGLSLLAYRHLGLISNDGGNAKTSDSDSLKGEIGHVTKTVTPTEGEVKLQSGFNPRYQARTMGGTIEEGEEIIVLDPGGGNVLTVDSLGVSDTDAELEEQLETDER